MQDILLSQYQWLKALHVVSIIAWMAGMLYLPRLFVYHAGVPIGSERSEMLKVMERRLLRYILNPSMIAAWVFGGLMIWANNNLFEQGWFHVKLSCVIIMTGLHHGYVVWFKKFRDDKNTRSDKFYRAINEVPTFLMIVIVVMVIVRPF